MAKHTKTIVDYTKGGVRYQHTFNTVLTPDQAKQRMLMEHHVSPNWVTAIEYAN